MCSQFVYHVLHSSGIADFQVPANLVKPVDFLKLPGRIVFQGDLKQLVEGIHHPEAGCAFTAGFCLSGGREGHRSSLDAGSFILFQIPWNRPQVKQGIVGKCRTYILTRLGWG